jgi:hypothetical protein
MTNQDITFNDLRALLDTALTALHQPTKQLPTARLQDWRLDVGNDNELFQVTPPSWCRYSRLLRVIKEINKTQPDLYFNIEKCKVDERNSRYCIILHRTGSELTIILRNQPAR